MQNRFLAGSIRGLLLCVAIAGLTLLPTDGVGASRSQSAAHKHDLGALQGQSTQPYTLFARTRYQWPFASGPLYGLEEAAGIADEPGVLRTRVGTFDLRRGTPSFPAELRAPVNAEATGSAYYIVVPDLTALKSGGFDAYRDAIVAQGGAFVAEAGNGAYIARLSSAALGGVRGRPTLAVLPYHPAFKLSPTIGRAPLFNEADAVSSIYKLTLSVFPGEDSALVAQAIRNLGGNVVRTDRVMVEADLDRSKLAQAAAIPAVSAIDERLPLVMWGEETTTVMQTGSYHGGAKPYHDVFVNGGGRRGTCSATTSIACQIHADCPGVETCSTNQPQILMTVDSGIQLDDGDLSDTRTSAGTPGTAHRKVRVYATTNQFGGSGDDRGCDSPLQGGFTHGHVVAATALGNATNVPIRYGTGWVKFDQNNVARPMDGVAPRAMLVSYDANVTPLTGNCADPNQGGLNVGSIYSGEGALASLEVSYHTHGARTFNFSWGTTNNATYGPNANSIDNFLQSHLDAMLFLAAGNDGEDVDSDFAPDPGSISDPATVKNAVVVGASGNTSETGSNSLLGGTNEQDRFATTSVGPATSASARIAPLLMAPGTDFGGIGENMGFDSEYSCRSNDNDQGNAVECDVAQGLSGTSFASPAAAGAAMLVRDYFAQGFYPDGTSANTGNASDVVTALSGAEVKAILIVSADWMDNSTADVPTNTPGDNLFQKFRFNREQGYGRIQLNNALPLQTYNPTPAGLIIADGGIASGRNDISGLSGDINTGAAESDTGTFTVCNDSQELRVALAWIDTPGESLNRNLDLELRAPSGKIYYGNYFTDDNNRDGTVVASEDCPNGHLTGSGAALDESPWSLETCANAVRDSKNPTEAVFLSPDARNDTTGVGFTADKQTELGTWTVIVRTGSPTTAGVQRYAVAVTGGVCLGSSVQLDRGSYVCNQPVTITVNEKDEAGDPAASLTDTEVAKRTTLEVYTSAGDRVDVESASSPGLYGFTHSGTKYSSVSIPLTDATSNRGYPATYGNGVLDVRSGETIKVTYRDKTSGAYDANKVRTSTASVNCQPAVTIGGVAFSQVGLDTAQLVSGGCERDARGLFTFGNPDRYMDEGERLIYQVAFQSFDSDLSQVKASLRCVLADADSPADCLPGTVGQCTDPNRTNNAPCGALMTITDSPKNIGSLPAGQVATPAFTIEMGTISGTPEVDMILGVSAATSGRTVETLLVTRNTLNADEVSTYYSTDFPSGGSEWADWPAISSGTNPSNEKVNGCLGNASAKVCIGGSHDGDPCTIPANCPGGSCSAPCPPPLTSAAEFFGSGADYRFDVITYSSLTATGRNLGFTGPWNFDTNNEGFTVGLNNTSVIPQNNTIANWGEDRNFNGVLDWFCANSPTTACPGPVAACGRCSNNSTIICSGSNAPCGGGGTTCTTDTALGQCQSLEDRDPQNGQLDDNWSTLGGCGWQTNGTTNAPATPGGVWHTGRVGAPGGGCSVNGSSCQSYEVVAGQNNIQNEWEELLTPVVQKVNVCTTGAEAGCGGVADTATRKVYTVEFTSWAWNMSMDLSDRWAQLRWEFDTDTTKLTPIDLVNDTVVLNTLQGNQGPVSGGNEPLTDGFQIFAPFAGGSPGNAASQNGTLGNNRVGRNPCYFETSSLIEPFHFADPPDDDLDNDSDGSVDEDVTPNGPLRNFDSFRLVSPAPDGRVFTLEDVYGPSGENFQGALGFRVYEGSSNSGAAQVGYGVAVDDMRVDWREYKLGADAANCASSGTCANVELDATQIFDGNGLLTITVTDPYPYRCLGAPSCVAENKNDCNHDGDFADAGDDNDCDNNGTPDVSVNAFSLVEPLGEWVILNRIGAGPSYRGSVPVTIGGDVPGVLFISDGASLLTNDVSVRYQDDWDGTQGASSGNKCANDPDPAKQGFVTTGVNLVVTDTGNISIVSFRVDDTIPQGGGSSDGDGYPDTNELVDLYVTLSNKTHQNLTHLVAQASVNDAKIECLLRSVSTLASMPAGTVQELPVPFEFKVLSTADRAGAGKTPLDDYSVLFTITLSADQFNMNTATQQIALDLDLDSVSPVANTTSFTESFESGFGSFQFLNLDVNAAANSNSNGMRCQYNDPDFINSNSYGSTDCYLGFLAGQSPANAWHLHSTSSPDGGRAYAGSVSIHYGVHPTPSDPNFDTYGTSQMDALRTKNAINLAGRVCSALQAGQVKSCNASSDCTNPASSCVSASPLFSFKHQISLADSRHTNTPDGQTSDRAVVHAQIAGASLWQKLTPYQNTYDVQGTDFFGECMFDPTDDGNDEDSYFNPTDPERRLGPSSTCYPEFVFAYLGDTSLLSFAVGNVGRASDGPGLQGSIGPGTWVESRFDLSRFRGRSVRLRYVITSLDKGDDSVHHTWQEFSSWNPTTVDDGWYVDDVRVSQTLGTSSPTVTNDTQNHGSTSCGATCNTLTGSLTANSLPGPYTSPSPGARVTLAGLNSVDRCSNGMLLYDFWEDVNSSGTVNAGDTHLGGPSPDSVFEVSPAVGTKYCVRVKCTSGTSSPCTGADFCVTVNVASSSPSATFPWQSVKFSSKSTLTWTTAEPGGVEVIRGNLSLLRSNGGNFNPTVLACVANDVTGTSATDATLPTQAQALYYLARRTTPDVTYSSYSPKESAGAGGTRDADLDGPPSKAANACSAPP